VTAGRTLIIGVDIGGTFTDSVVLDDDGHITTGKVPTTPADRSIGFFESIADAAAKRGNDLPGLLAQCRRLVHGTTTGTNAIVQRAGANVGVLATRGHEDVMFVMKGTGRTAGLSSEQALDIPNTYKPVVLVPRGRIRPITERIDVDGDIVVPLDEDEVRRAAEDLLAAGVEALTISFLWSTLNPAHEKRAKEIALDVNPAWFVSCGAELSQKSGEYERTTTAVMNSFIGPLMVDYVDRIQDRAAQLGFPVAVEFTQCSGGAITSSEVRRAPIRTVQSGPVAGTTATKMISDLTGMANVIAIDMGGTTFDVSVIHDGRPLQRDVSIFERYAMALPMLDIESVGAGGGSIAWIDEQGRLNVGPHSAGARPGPACYGFGGERPTVTDADVLLGLINPDRYLGGRMKLDTGLAEEAIRPLAKQLGLSLLETAAGISTVVDAKMADLVRRMTLLRGLDPRRFVCAAFGGGGPLHGSAVAMQAGIDCIVVPLPESASVWSALGAATSDISALAQRWTVMPLPVRGAALESVFNELELSASEALLVQGVAMADLSLARSVRMRYAMQIHDVEVPVKLGTLDDGRVAELDADFHAIHEQLFGRDSGYREGGTEITAFQVQASARRRRPPIVATKWPDTASASGRDIYWPELGGHVETPVFVAPPDGTLNGPAVVELPDTVIVVRPGQTGTRDEFGNYLIRSEASTRRIDWS
jgi:N-methylhydantoinase A